MREAKRQGREWSVEGVKLMRSRAGNKMRWCRYWLRKCIERVRVVMHWWLKSAKHYRSNSQDRTPSDHQTARLHFQPQRQDSLALQPCSPRVLYYPTVSRTEECTSSCQKRSLTHSMMMKIDRSQLRHSSALAAGVHFYAQEVDPECEPRHLNTHV